MRAGNFEELLSLAKEGDRPARNQLAALISAMAHERASRRLGPRLRRRFDSMDVSQDVVVRALKDLAEFRGKTPDELAAWVVGRVEREICDQADFHGAKKRNLDRERPLPTGPEREISAAHGGAVPTLLDEAARREALAAMRRAIAALGPMDRLLLDLREKGKTWDSVAAALDLPSADAARARQRRILARLDTHEHPPDGD